MEDYKYDTGHQASGSISQLASAQASRCDLNSLRNQLDGHVTMARHLAERVRLLADSLVGITPINSLGNGATAPDPADPPLSALINRLGQALADIDAGLSRL